MTDSGYRHYVAIIDRSGSMASIRDETESGVRHYVREQQKLPGKATLSLFQFDTEHEQVHDFTNLSDVPEYTLSPRGMTALNDAVGFAIARTGERLAAIPENERPGRVLVLIVTDGEENASQEHNAKQIGEMIEHQRSAYKWEFTFIGANQDVFKEAGKLGLSRDQSLSYAATRSGTKGAWVAASAASSRYMTGQDASVTYTSAERKSAGADGNDSAV